MNTNSVYVGSWKETSHIDACEAASLAAKQQAKVSGDVIRPCDRLFKVPFSVRFPPVSVVILSD